MRPLKLVIQAFGSYSKKEEIDFSALGKSNIFLITGNTGSGKTTIFDAICFALFNTSSGSFRGNNFLRSHYAKDDTKSFVEFEFIFNDKTYKIIRSPQYQRKKLKGEGIIKENAAAELYLPNGEIIYGVNEVNEYIINLLGLNHAQFSRIALLAQGEFLKLLNSSTNERSEIFRNIFNTQNFLTFQNNLKDEFLKYKNIIADIQKSISQYVCQIKTSDEEFLNIINNFNQTNIELDLIIENLKQANKENDKKLKNYQKELDKSSKEYKKLYDVYQKILSKNNLLKRKIETVNEIETQKAIFEDIKKEYISLDKKNIEIKQLEFEINKLNNDKQKAKEIILNEENYNKNKTKYKNLKEKEVKLAKELEDIKFEFLRFKHFEIEKLNDELNTKRLKLTELKKEFDNKNLIYCKNYDIYLSSQAGILAKNLKNNTPCPVCGSKIHPKPAKILNDDISKEFLNKLKEELEENQKTLDKISLDCSLLIEKQKIKKEDFEKYKKEINTKKEINLNENVLSIDFENKIKEISKNIEENKLKINEINILNTSLKTKINTLKSQIKEADINKIIKTYDDLNLKLNILNKEKNEILSNYEKQNLKLTSLISNNDMLDKQLSELNDINEKEMEKTETELQKTNENIDLYNSKIKNISLIKGINDDIEQNLISKSKDYNKNYEFYNSYKLLCDCANGNLKGKQKITFEQYIQSYYLDLVLIEANKILKMLTKGRFQFLRNKDTSKTQTKTGLDIEIMDFYTYKTRSTKTLSGGESFMASLSLALGLSVTVSNLSGAKNIDVLFVDEGFGTLDSESLDVAINQIIDLCLNNRIVGIISHIEELKNKIQNQIKTIKTQSGSHIETNF